MVREDINYLAQHIEVQDLKKFYEAIDKKYGVEILNKPSQQTILLPVKDPISGGSFYGGEILVTSTIVQVEKEKGWSMVMDDNEELSLFIATLDASFANNIETEKIQQLLEGAKENLAKKSRVENRKVHSTKVSFDLM